MINDVDESLRALIRRDVLNGTNVEISFEAPTREWSVRRNTPTLNLYLYEIREDLERREVQYEEVRDERGHVVDRRLPPRRFKLSYLVTAWTQRPDDEHRLLSSALLCFLRFDALPADIVQGELASLPYPIRVTVGLPLPPERSISDVWTALGGELKPSLDLVLTTPFPTNRQQPVGPPVLEEPRIGLSSVDGQAEKAKSKRRGGRAGQKPKEGSKTRSGSKDQDEPEAESKDEAPVASEVRLGGKGPEGRTFKMRALPRP